MTNSFDSANKVVYNASHYDIGHGQAILSTG